MSEQQTDWVESIEVFSHWGAEAWAEWRARVFWREHVEGGE